jgi:fanconi-associated nuclease 1
MIVTRLAELRNGKAVEIFEQVDSQHRERQTWCVGVHWEYTRDELREILEVCFAH